MALLGIGQASPGGVLKGRARRMQVPGVARVQAREASHRADVKLSSVQVTQRVHSYSVTRTIGNNSYVWSTPRAR